MSKTIERPDFSERCRRESTRDVVFLLQSRKLNTVGCPDGWDFDDEGDFVQVEDECGDPIENGKTITQQEAWEQSLLHGDYDVPCVIEEWHTEGVWLSREEANAYAEAHHYNYRHGFRVYGVASNGELAELIKTT